MFSGQGSHYFKMGQVLYEEKPVFRMWMQRLDQIVQDQTGYSVIDSLYESGHIKTMVFDQTLLTHPAIFMVEYALAQTLLVESITPDLLLGTSLGSFAAAAVAGCIDVEDGITAVLTQARLIEAHCQKGGMIAIFANPSIHLKDILKSNCEIASYNFSTHFVVAAKQSDLENIENLLRAKNLNFQRLPVSFAFHSSWIEEAEKPFKEFLKLLSFRPAAIPIVCCAQANVLLDLPENYFWEVIREPIHFQETIEYIEKIGRYRYIDVGPAGTLATFLKYGLPTTSTSKVLSTLTPYGHDLKNLISVITNSN